VRGKREKKQKKKKNPPKRQNCKDRKGPPNTSMKKGSIHQDEPDAELTRRCQQARQSTAIEQRKHRTKMRASPEKVHLKGKKLAKAGIREGLIKKYVT